MKKLIPSLLLLFTGLYLFAQSPAATYSSKSGKIVYQYEIGETVTNYVILFDNYGKKQVFEATSNSSSGLNDKVRTIVLPDAMYIVNYAEKQIVKFPITPGDEEQELEMSGESPIGGIDLNNLVNNLTTDEGHKAGKETVLGKSCDVYEIGDEDGKGKYWIWNGILVKAEFNDGEGQHIYMVAKEIKMDYPVTDKDFALPAGFQITDMSEMMDQMKQLQDTFGTPDEDEK